jgi:hypothetical protein
VRIVLGIVSGFLLGLGIAVLLFTYAKIAFGTNAPSWIAVGGTLVGLLVGVLATIVRRSPSATET